MAALPGYLLQSCPVSAPSLQPIAESNIAFLVLQYLRVSKYKRTYEAFLSESSDLTASLVSFYRPSPEKLSMNQPKSLWAILSEYTTLKQEDMARNRLFPPEYVNGPLAARTQDTFSQLSLLLADYAHIRRANVSQLPAPVDVPQVPPLRASSAHLEENSLDCIDLVNILVPPLPKPSDIEATTSTNYTPSSDRKSVV